MFGTIAINIRRRRRRKVISFRNERIKKRSLRDSTNFLEFPEELFVANFHVSKEVFFMLLQEMEQRMKTPFRNTHIPAAIKLATFLSFVATGGYQRSVGNVVTSLISKSRVCFAINECLDIFDVYLCPKWIKLTKTVEEENATKENFYRVGDIPCVVGCVDGTHVRIKSPGDDVKHLYYNCKGFYSINVMAICDDKMKITYVDARHPGANNDAFIWNHSTAHQHFKEQYLDGKTNTWLLGDSDYNLLPYMLTPYKNPREQWQKTFNERHCKTRGVIERCFGVLKTRFRCIGSSRALFYTPEKTTKIVNACCAIHNICIAYKSIWLPSNSPTADADVTYEETTADDIKVELYEETSSGHSLRDQIAINLQ